jgi:hypothetical protein
MHPARRTTRTGRRSPQPGWSWLLASLLCVLAFVTPGRAWADAWGQYLVILDDSGSMTKNDPDRLVVMASMALAAALDDADQVMLVGLNELALEDPGVRFVSPRELLPGRDGPQGRKPLEGERPARIGRFAGQTPCREALDRARAILESVASAGVPQTLFFLSDGECNGARVEEPASFLGGLTAHREGRFRFVLLVMEGKVRVDPTLSAYAKATGWTGDATVRFDARSLLRGFAEVLSFSRGLRYDDGGRVGLERTFAGARNVRVLSIAQRGADQIDLVRVREGEESPIDVGPTFAHPEHGWSLRVAKIEPAVEPYSVRSTTPGAEVLVIPSYGALTVEAVVAPCGDAPPKPWTREHPVRAGQPACAWARLVGDRGDSVVPGRSFAFDLELCEDAACERATAMQPSGEGDFNAQIGAEHQTGRHERWFRAHRGALARSITVSRGFQAMSFGIQRISTPDDPERAITEVDLGVLPKQTAEALTLDVRGAFPAGARAEVACKVEGDSATQACIECAPVEREIELQDPFKVQLRVEGAAFCPLVSRDGQPLPVRLELSIEPRGDAAADIGAHVVPIRATLQYAAVTPAKLSIVGGDASRQSVEVPSPVGAEVEVELVGDLPSGLTMELAEGARVRLGAAPGGTDTIMLSLAAEDCCRTGTYAAELLVREPVGGTELRVPVELEVIAPGWWTCPGKVIARWAAVVFGVLLLVWIVRGFVTPARFPDGAVLARADSHPELSKLTEGDEDWRLVRIYSNTQRGFYKPATIHLGGADAPLASLRAQSADARIEARKGGGATLVVDGPGVETFSESKGWTELEPGTTPIHSSLVLRRGDTYLLFRP